MRKIAKIGWTCILLLFFLCGSTWAALPDPIEFGLAVEMNHLDRVRAWLDEGLDPEFQGREIGTGLMIAAWHGNIPMMALFIERGANPRRANRNGEQPLQLAAWNNHRDAIKWLLDHGAAINREGNYWGALHYAVFNGHTELAQFLIERGAEINAKSPNGSTPLMMAAREGREALARTLLESGADSKAKNDWGDTALTLAMRYDHYRPGKLIATPEEFEIADKAPKEPPAEPVRSAAAPSEIELLLQQIREAEAAHRPTDELKKRLMVAVESFRRSSVNVGASRRPMPLPYQPRSIVITAKRGNPGAERAQVIVDGKSAAPAKAGVATVPVAQPRTPPRPSAGQVAELMRQIRLAEAQGQAAEGLRKQLFDTVEQMKQ